MASLNSVQLIGNLGQDPELRKTAAGTPVTNLNVATNEAFTDGAGNRQTRTEWHRVVVWGAQADGMRSIPREGTRGARLRSSSERVTGTTEAERSTAPPRSSLDA